MYDVMIVINIYKFQFICIVYLQISDIIFWQYFMY